MKPCPKCWGTGSLKDHQRLGRIARQARERRGEKLAQAARRLGITESFLSYLECGKRGWKKETYLKAIHG